MKKFFLLALAALATSIVASAGTVTSNCSLFPVQFPNGNTNTPQTVSCPGLNVGAAASGLNSVTLNYFVDYQFGSTGTNTVSVTFTPATFGGTTWTTPITTVTSTGGQSSAGIQTGSAAASGGLTLANFASAFNVSIGSSVAPGTVATSSGAVSVTYNYKDAAPEPATISLIGISLIGLGFAARRRRS
jgi:PEP-CTERM motif